MFTIKVYYPNGHAAFECEAYQFQQGDMDAEGLPLTIDRITYRNSHDEEDRVISVGANSIYVMNSHGKTVDSFHMHSPDNPRRWSVDPDCARRLAGQGHELALKYISRFRPHEEQGAQQPS